MESIQLRKETRNLNQLVDLFLRFNRRLNFSVQHTPHELNINDSHILMEIGFNPGILAKQLVSVLNMEKSILSRALKNLQLGGYLRARSSSVDKREKFLELTAKGYKVVKNDSKARDAMALHCVVALEISERQELTKLLNIFADNLQALDIETRLNDEPLKIAIRRLTRSMGFLGNNTFGSGLPVEELQVLYNIHGHGNSISMTQLRDLLPYELSMLSRLITKLSGEFLIKKDAAQHDKRFINLRLLSKGISKIQTGIVRAEELMERGTSAMTKNEFLRLITLLEAFLIFPELCIDRDLQSSLRFKKIKDENDRQMARNFVVDSLLRQNKQHELPAKLFDTNHKSYSIFSDEELVGVCDIKNEGQNWDIGVLTCNQNRIPKLAAFILLERSLEDIFADDQAAIITMRSDLNSAVIPQTLSNAFSLKKDIIQFTAQNHKRLERLVFPQFDA